MAATVRVNPRLTNVQRECQDAVCGGCCPRLVDDARSVIPAKAGIQGWWGSHRRTHLPTWDRFAVREQSIQSRFAGTSRTFETFFRPAKKSLAAGGRFAGDLEDFRDLFRSPEKKFSRQRTLPDTPIRGGYPLGGSQRKLYQFSRRPG